MYELNNHEKHLVGIIEALKKDADENSLEGLIVIKVQKNKNKEIDIQAAFGGITQFEWIGILDYVVDIVKGSCQ